MASDAAPAPISFDPAQNFDGNDGKWSTFVVRVGTPEQNFRVLPASATGEIVIPLAEGCIESDPENCGELRGAFPFDGFASSGFQINKSSTWNEIGLYDVELESELNYSANAIYGLETVGLMVQNTGGPTLKSQVVAGIASKDFYLGLFGLSPKAANFSEFDHPQRSYITTLKDEGKIPSVSYGYTAGANYSKSRVEDVKAQPLTYKEETPKALASLTIGGHDEARYEAHDISFPFDPDDSRPLSIKIQRISVSDTARGRVSLLEQETYVDIDFSVPHLWLPREACDRFEAIFGLIHDNYTDLYLVNDTVHAELQERNPAITIGLGTSANPAERVNVVLPYAAFDLQAEHPIYPNATNYFPIRRGANDSQYTLGRVFMQEAYIIVDHERSNFSVHQALFPPTTAEKRIVSIAVPETSTSTESQPALESRNRLSRGAIAGIVVGAVVLIMTFISIAIVLRRRRRRRHIYKPEQKYEHQGLPELTEDEKPRIEHSGEERHEMYEPLQGELDGDVKAELEATKQSPQELPAEATHRRNAST